MSRLAQLVEQAKHASPPEGMATRVIAIDGLGGAGKTTLAQVVSTALGDAPIVHTDDFASSDNTLDWWPRLLEQVLEPISQNRPARYQRFDWPTRRMAEWHDVAVGEYVVLEGVSAAREAFRPYLSFAIWVDTPRNERLRRGLTRDGQDAREQWLQWMEDEDRYVDREAPEDHVDAIVRGRRDLGDL